jgi:hypothetical protein
MRDFKGVWIPREVWLDEGLTWMEKLFLVEIDSLDNKEGCFASNAHFAEFFAISKSRSSDIIGSLAKKGRIKTLYRLDGCKKMRVIKVFGKLTGGIRKTDRGYSENGECINTINNTKRESIPPSHSDVTEYIKENSLTVDADRFIDYYHSVGWKVGSRVMKSWKATLRNWSRKDKVSKPAFGEERFTL